MSSTIPSLDASFHHLREVRLALLRFHKALLDSERTAYEQSYGRIQSNNEFFRLVLEDEWFSWLRPVSQFIVQIDMAMSAKEPVTLSEVKDLLAQARKLVQADEAGTPLAQGHYRAIQRDPDIAFMHAEVSHLIDQ